jgi:hypothetical protein
LSIGESATFCPVCGTPVGGGDAVATAVEESVAFDAATSEAAGPREMPEDESSAPILEAAVDQDADASEASVPGSEAEAAQPFEDVPELEHQAELDAAPVTGHSSILEAGPESGPSELVANLAAGTKGAAKVEPVAPAESEVSGEPAGSEEPAEPEDSPEDVRERRMAEISALLEFGSRCEEANPARAAVVYGEVVVGCLEITEDPLGTETVRRDLLRGFDRLSFVLERQGLPEEALAVVDDAASLGLLEGANGVADARASLRDRREGLRRILYGDWAQL